jgi:thiamine-phosphate pyrophosphorylase
MEVFKSAGLYLVTSSELSNYPTLEVIERSLKSGCKLFQLREKNLTKDEYKELAFQARVLADRYGAIFIVNDHADVALEVGADGVHLGQDDMSVKDARKILGHEFIIGVSTHNSDEVIKAQNEGADYINIGPVFPTSTKPDVISLGLDEIKSIIPNVKVPFTFMGGIKLQNIESLKSFKPAAVAMITELTRAESVEAQVSQALKQVSILF